MKYFNYSEFTCHHCGELPANGMNTVLLDKLDKLRELCGAPIIVNSAYRCPTHNANVRGQVNSQHLYGTAADIWCPELGVDELADKAVEVGFDGIGRYYGQEFVHVDVRDNGESPNYYTWSE